MKQTLCLLLGLITIQATHAQDKLRIEHVRSANLRNSGTIYGDADVKGYFFFLQTDKVSKKENEYLLKLTDQNLNPAKEISFVDSKELVLLESAYNGKDLIFQFYNKKGSYLEYRTYSTDGKLKGTFERPLDKKSKNYFENYIELNEESKTLFPLGKSGFASIIPIREGNKYSYEVNFILPDKQRLIPYNPGDEEKYAQAQYIGSTDSVMLIQVMKKGRMLSQDLESWLVGFNIQTGKQLFEMETIQDYNFYPMNVSAIGSGGGKFMLMGPYFKKNDRAVRDKSLGLGVWVMDSKGKVVTQKYNSWEKDLSKILPVNAKGRVENLGYVYFHSVQQNSAGEIFAVGEGYKKQASTLGIATNLLAGGSRASMVKIRTTDMVLVRFNKDFQVTDAKIYDKTNNDVALPAGAETINAPSLALMIKAFGGFDYEFTQRDDNADEFVIGYADYERSSDFKGLTFNTIHVDGSTISTDKIPLKSKASSMRVLPAKIGSIMILEYSRKEKTVDARIEKLN